MNPRAVSHSIVVDAPPEEVFDLLADPRRHAEIDGSGMVRGELKAPERLSYGSTFSMKMRMVVPYRITNTVVEFSEGRLIAWRHVGRHIWRWELEPEGEGTRVTETFDWSTALSPRALELLGYPERNAKAIQETLARLAARCSRSSTA
jgi:uncharacterized protein YndB with AHSA1/START domain